MQPQSWPEPDPQVAAAIRAMYRGRREAPLAVQVRDRLGELFPDAAFADAFGQVGKPGWSPGRLALVTVLQKAANLTDRQAADEVRENLACGAQKHESSPRFEARRRKEPGAQGPEQRLCRVWDHVS